MDAPFLLIAEDLRVAPGRRVLKASEYAALVDAQGLLDAARRSAEASAGRAKREVQAERERGFREGADEARREAAATLTQIAAGASATLAQIEPLIVEAVMTALRGVLDDASAAVFYDAALRKVARLVRDQRFLTLRVAPDDEGAARERLDALQAAGVFVGFVDIETDPTLAPRSAILRSESGTVDASLSLQLEGIAAALSSEAGAIAASISTQMPVPASPGAPAADRGSAMHRDASTLEGEFDSELDREPGSDLDSDLDSDPYLFDEEKEVYAFGE